MTNLKNKECENPPVKKKHIVKQVLVKDGLGRYRTSSQFFETLEKAKNFYRFYKVIKLLDYTATEVEL